MNFTPIAETKAPKISYATSIKNEDAAIEERLRQLGCHKGQGWHFGRPASIAATRTLLAERNLLPALRGKSAAKVEVAEGDFDEGLRATG